MTIKEVGELYVDITGKDIEMKSIDSNTVQIITEDPLPTSWKEFLEKNFSPTRILYNKERPLAFIKKRHGLEAEITAKFGPNRGKIWMSEPVLFLLDELAEMQASIENLKEAKEK